MCDGDDVVDGDNNDTRRRQPTWKRRRRLRLWKYELQSDNNRL